VRDAIAGLSPGGVTKAFRSFARLHLFKLYARRPAVVTPFADVTGVIRAELTRRLRAAALDDWLARAQGRASVEVLP
jgi:parvulin-like peptidyl-prolyl isomerase